MKGSFLVGFLVGGVSVLLFNRLQEVVEQDDPETITDRMGRQLEILEERVGELTRQKATAKA